MRQKLLYTGDESWIYNPETKQQSIVCVFQDEPNPAKFFTLRGAAGAMLFVAARVKTRLPFGYRDHGEFYVNALPLTEIRSHEISSSIMVGCRSHTDCSADVGLLDGGTPHSRSTRTESNSFSESRTTYHAVRWRVMPHHFNIFYRSRKTITLKSLSAFHSKILRLPNLKCSASRPSRPIPAGNIRAQPYKSADRNADYYCKAHESRGHARRSNSPARARERPV
ncbi:hypothetical protein EVAR_17552_1 [Eumeta japonica]|uniref:Uncharacterized protein n=1 Tax=Eumeta variegata TaxID=151549 RepID=A0A4C1WPQ0_EUMVA|nr:hypothetical protein EVAR_17552_1 [Eumeta japonica]